MSSIISDIFYNSHNPKAIDSFLINRHGQGNNNSLQSGSYISKNSSKTHQTTIGINFSIIISAQIVQTGQQQYLFSHKNPHCLSIIFGQFAIEQPTTVINRNQIKVNFQLNDVPIQEIYRHTNIRLSLKLGGITLGCCYIPMENVIDLINYDTDVDTNSRNIVTKIKLNGSNKKQTNILSKTHQYCKVSCDIQIHKQDTSSISHTTQNNQNHDDNNNYHKTQNNAKLRPNLKNTIRQPQQLSGDISQINQYAVTDNNQWQSSFPAFRDTYSSNSIQKQSDRAHKNVLISNNKLRHKNIKSGLMNIGQKSGEQQLKFGIKPDQKHKQNNKSNIKQKRPAKKYMNEVQSQSSWTRLFNQNEESSDARFPNSPQNIQDRIKKQPFIYKQEVKMSTFAIKQCKIYQKTIAAGCWRFRVTSIDYGTNANKNESINGNQAGINIKTLNEQIAVNSSEYSRSGLRLEILQKQQVHPKNTQGDNKMQQLKLIVIGYSVLNTLVLLDGYISGLFPIMQEQTHQCIGTIQLESKATRVQQYQNKQQKQYLSNNKIQQNYGNISYQNESSNMAQQNSQQKNHNSFITNLSIQFCKLLLLIKIDKNTSIQESQQPKIIIRINRDIVYCQSKGLKLQHKGQYNHIGTDETQYSAFEIISQKSIYIIGLDNIQQCQIKIQIEVYIGYRVVGYGHMCTQWKTSDNSSNSIEYQVFVNNLTTQGSICHSIFRICRVNNQPQYLLNTRMQQNLHTLTSQQIINTLSSNKNYYQKSKKLLHRKLIQIMMNQHLGYQYSQQQQQQVVHGVKNRKRNSPIYIQCVRMADLLLNSVASNNICRVMTKNSETSVQYSTKFLEQLLYLDSQCRGYVRKSDLQTICEYYSVPEYWKRCQERTLSMENKDENQQQMLYLFVFCGVQLDAQYITGVDHDTQQVGDNMIEQPQQCNDVEQKNHNQMQKIETKTKAQHSRYLISQIICKNMQCLMHDHSIPSLRVQFITSSKLDANANTQLKEQPQQCTYISRTVYSSAHPHFILSQQAILHKHDRIQMVHRNVKNDCDIIVWDVQFMGEYSQHYRKKDADIKIVSVPI